MRLQGLLEPPTFTVWESETRLYRVADPPPQAPSRIELTLGLGWQLVLAWGLVFPSLSSLLLVCPVAFTIYTQISRQVCL